MDEQFYYVLVCLFACFLGLIPINIRLRFLSRERTRFGFGFLKGALAVVLASEAGFDFLEGILEISFYDVPLYLTWLSGFLVVVVHCHWPWTRSDREKGVSVGLGALAMMAPWTALAAIVGFLLCFVHNRQTALSSLMGIMVAGTIQLVIYPIGAHLWFAVLMVLVVLFRFESEIDKILESRERSV